MLKGLSGECEPDVARLNDACAALEADKSVGLTCGSGRPTPEWPACERRDLFELQWDQAPDSGRQSGPRASGWVHEARDISDGGP